jgi:hypothetical protein
MTPQQFRAIRMSLWLSQIALAKLLDYAPRRESVAYFEIECASSRPAPCSRRRQ